MNSEEYLDFIRNKPCAWCGAPPRTDPHHIKTGGMGATCSDLKTIPLCRGHHGEYHATNAIAPFDPDKTKLWITQTALDCVCERLEELMTPNDQDKIFMSLQDSIETMKINGIAPPYRITMPSKSARALLDFVLHKSKKPKKPTIYQTKKLATITFSGEEVELYEVG